MIHRKCLDEILAGGSGTCPRCEAAITSADYVAAGPEEPPQPPPPQEKQEEKCSICTDKLVQHPDCGEVVQHPHCKDQFHRRCLEDWWRSQREEWQAPSCPNCREKAQGRQPTVVD